jgi:hypothetical protein
LEAECGRIEREARRLEVDGCFWLWHVHQGQDAESANPRSILERHGIACGVFGGPKLRSMLAATKAIVAWAKGRTRLLTPAKSAVAGAVSRLYAMQATSAT